MRLRAHPVTLVLAALVPVLGFAAAVARTVDKEIEAAITALEALAQSEHLDTMTLAPFYTLSERSGRCLT
ncbi:MAG: hypothetical protein ACREI6_05090 [Candidatus Rokuibacteriota bacterium]